MNKRVIELIRVSTEGQAAQDRGGIPAQREANRRTVTNYGLEVVKTIELADVSGSAVLRTPEILELMRLIESPDIHGVVAKEFSRLMRPENFEDFALLQAFADTATILYLPDGPLDFASKSGRLLGTIRAAIAGHERQEILERIWLAKEEKRKAGKHPQSRITLPFGVSYEESTGWRYTAEAEKVRAAFKLFLSGNTSYWAVGHKLGIDPPSLRIILRNPIYMGWRVISQRRDPSPKAHRTKPDGRQADRPKIARAPDEVIRRKVLDPPLVSEEDFLRVQQLMDLKKQKHWRARPDYEPRFTYNGFLRCACCGNLIYTHVRRPDDWYFCKSRTTAERRARESKGLGPCSNPYMGRERLDGAIDHILSERLTDAQFLRRVAQEYAQSQDIVRCERDAPAIQLELQHLEDKRQRVLETYFEGHIGREQRDQRLSEIERDKKVYQDLLLTFQPAPAVASEDLARVFAVLHEWEFLTRRDKRSILQTLVPEIHVRNYSVVGITLTGDAISQDEVSRSRAGSSMIPRANAPARHR